MRKAKSVLRTIIIVAVVAAVCLIGGYLWRGYKDTPKITSQYISQKLSDESTLVTQKLTQEGFSEYTDDGVPVLTKGDFTITYKAEVTAGIDVKKIKVVKTDRKNQKIILQLPEAEIFSVKIDPNTVEYHDQKIALFNTDRKEDSDKAEALAEEDARKAAESSGLLENANAVAQTLIRGLLQDSVSGYTIEFV